MNLAANPNLEVTALKALIDNPETAALFDESFFSTPQSSVVFKLLQGFTASNKIDRNLLYNKLLQADLLDVVGERFIDDLFDAVYDKELLEAYASELRSLALKRKLQVNLYTLMQRSSKMDLGDILAELSTYSSDLLATYAPDEESFKTLLTKEFEAILEPGATMSKFIKTGFKDIDTLLGGIERSNLELIAGRPSMGKSALLLRFLLNMAKNGVPVELISFEMSNQQITRRVLSMETGIPGHRLQNGAISEAEKELLRAKIAELQRIPLSLSFTALPTITDLTNHIRMAVRARNISVVGIDYAQLLQVKDGHETQDLANIARSLKIVANQESIGIFLVSQLNRGVEQRRDKRPLLSDLRQSGGLEENADKVIFVYRPSYYEPQNDSMRGLAEIIYAKNRNGPIATFNMFFDEESTNFYTL